MFNIEDIKKTLREEDLKVLKSLGQNFLIDEKVLEDIVAAADLGPEDVVVEVGPGMGTLSFALAEKCKKVVAIEKDRKMGKVLRKEILEKLGEKANIEILSDDILKINLSEFLAMRGIKKYKLVSNIPYYITSPIIKLFLEAEIQPEMIVLLMQKEVAERICAKKGDLSVLALSVLLYGEPEMARTVSHEAFYPAPKVDSTVLKISNISKKYSVSDYQKIFRIIKIGFSSKRKKLVNNLSAGLKMEKIEVEKILSDCNIGASARAQDLEVVDWVKLKDLDSI
ncbi:MAG: 16S rRNA (adenine(1518)-N(6)/adenine(1519)-N(6))-dimethyltransferase RsmA [Candidatus Pacebacteria bacterium]|nr:16S rRNA (adenine(1518)-N(6)/adenine(1519)-N(6))-dimethyltransferase RsmA [Candidatus Paceibacterota bacterium]